MNEYIEAKVLIAYLIEQKSHRYIQQEILGKPAPLNGGGYEAMNILHSFDIKEDSKGLLNENLDKINQLNPRAQEILKNYFEANEEAEKIISEIIINPTNKSTERLSVTKTRIYQDVLKTHISRTYQNCCALCNVDQKELLNASHIIPWSVNSDTRLHLDNSILLCSFHDKLFDKGLITLDEEFNVLLSKKLSSNVVAMLENIKFRQPISYSPNSESLSYHRKKIFKG